MKLDIQINSMGRYYTAISPNGVEVSSYDPANTVALAVLAALMEQCETVTLNGKPVPILEILEGGDWLNQLKEQSSV